MPEKYQLPVPQPWWGEQIRPSSSWPVAHALNLLYTSSARGNDQSCSAQFHFTSSLKGREMNR